MIYMCPMKQTVCVNIVDFKMCYFDYAHQNKKSTFQNSFRQKDKKRGQLCIVFYKAKCGMTEFP